MRRIKFSLTSLLVLTTALAAVLAYSQWRRQQILRDVAALQAKGVEIQVNSRKFFTPVPDECEVRFQVVSQGQYRIGDKLYSFEGAKAHYGQIKRDLDDLGVTRQHLSAERGQHRAVLKSVDALPRIFEYLDSPGQMKR